MITLYTGSPGSGKSYNCLITIIEWLSKKKNNFVLGNFDVNLEKYKNYKKLKGHFTRLYDEDINVNYVINFSQKYLKKGVESQALLVIDEASLYFNSREWMKDKSRKDWIKFLSQHRKFGYDIIFICQDDRQIDRQIRALVEYEKVHRKVNNSKLLKHFPITLFAVITRRYVINTKIDSTIIAYKEKYGKLYDTFNTFNYEKHDVDQDDKT